MGHPYAHIQWWKDPALTDLPQEQTFFRHIGNVAKTAKNIDPFLSKLG